MVWHLPGGDRMTPEFLGVSMTLVFLLGGVGRRHSSVVCHSYLEQIQQDHHEESAASSSFKMRKFPMASLLP